MDSAHVFRGQNDFLCCIFHSLIIIFFATEGDEAVVLHNYYIKFSIVTGKAVSTLENRTKTHE
jgi:hypothetical protein